LNSYQDTVKFYKSKNNELLAYNNTIEMSLDNLSLINRKLKEELENMKIVKPKVVTKIVTKVEVKEIPVYYETPLPCDSFKKFFKYEDSPWLTIQGLSTEKGLTFNNISLYNDLTVAVGEKKRGFLRRNEYITSIKSNNPYFNIESIESYNFKPKEPFYDKWWFKASIFTTGFILGTKM
jgi:hypothetical protein